MKKETKNLILIFSVALIVRIIFSFSFFVHWWDESVYLSLGHDLSKSFFQYTLANAGWSDYIPFGSFPYSWPNMGFRAPLLPYLLSIFYFLKLGFLINFLTPFVGALSVIAVYFLGKESFNEKTGFYSALLFTLIPFNLYNNSMIMTGTYTVFFLILTFLFFWKGFEKNERKYKILFGVFLAISLLARYTILWITPVFLIYFLIRDKNLNFLGDKYLWGAILAFFIVLIPWFVYGYVFYDNILGAFIHGVKAATYWGGIQESLFYFKNFWRIFSILGILFVVAGIGFFKNKDFKKRPVYLLLLWFGFFLLVASLVGHKEERFILPILPPLTVLVGNALTKIKKHSKKIFGFIFLIFLVHCSFSFVENYNNSHTGTNSCFNEAMQFIEKLPENSLIITDETPIVYAYTHRTTRYYPTFWSVSNLENKISENETDFTYIFYTDMDMPLYDEKNVKLKKDLDENYDTLFVCDKDWGLATVYKFSR